MAMDKKGKGPIRGKKKVPSKLDLEREDKRNLIILLAIGIALKLVLSQPQGRNGKIVYVYKMKR